MTEPTEISSKTLLRHLAPTENPERDPTPVHDHGPYIL